MKNSTKLIAFLLLCVFLVGAVLYSPSADITNANISICYDEHFKRMGLLVDFGGTLPMEPNLVNHDEAPVATPIGGGWYSMPSSHIITAIGPSIRRYSQEVEISITEEDMHILLELFHDMMINNERMFCFDEYFVTALEEAGLYDTFFTEVSVWLDIMIENCPYSSAVREERARMNQ